MQPRSGPSEGVLVCFILILPQEGDNGRSRDNPAFDLKIAARAAENFKLRKQQRETKEKAINEGRDTEAESSDRGPNLH